MDEYKIEEIEILDDSYIFATEKGLKTLQDACQEAIDDEYAIIKNVGLAIHISKKDKEYFLKEPEPLTFVDELLKGLFFFFIFGIWGIGIFATIKWLFW